MRETFLIRMPSEIKDWLTSETKRRGLTLTGLILAILSEYQKQNS